jgi:uncharacterized protein YunC (DUF1805 family)
MTMNKIVLALGALLAACSGSAVPGAAAPTVAAATCDGGSVRGDAELERYGHCATIAGDLDVTGVTSVEPLRRLRAVDGTLSIHRTERLYSLSGLENLRRVDTLRIEQNRGLISIGSLNALAHAEKVSIVANPRLSGSRGLMDGLKRAAAEITMLNNAGLRAEGVAMGSRASML